MATQDTVRLSGRFGPYQIVKLLGEGGMGAVYLARDSRLDRAVALKVPQFGDDPDGTLLARFYEEAKAAATLNHPNVCPVYEVGQVNGVHYLTMAFVEGKPLAEWVRGGKPLTQRQVAVLARKVALALHEAHQRGVIHRDLKPANLMIDKRGEPIVMDFGLARRTRPGDQRLTQSGAIFGSPAYMAPEQAKGDVRAMGPGCDIYSLGVVLYELLTRRLPFTGDTMAILAQILMDPPPPPSQFRPDLDPPLEAICLKAMAKAPADRYRSMAELANALLSYVRGLPLPEPPTQPLMTSAPDAATLPPRAAPVDRTQPTVAPDVPTLPLARPKPERRAARRGRGRPASQPWVWWAGGAAALLVMVGVYLASRPDTSPDNRPTAPSDNPAPELTAANPAAVVAPPARTTPAAPPPPQPPDPFRPLITGEDLVGAAPGIWRLEPDELQFTVAEPVRQRGWLLTNRDYTNFLLNFEFQLSPGANSGVALRAAPWSQERRLEVQILDDAALVYAKEPPHNRTGALFGVAVQEPARLNPTGDWNQMEIELRGWSLRVAVNGRETVRTQLNSDEVIRHLNAAPNASGRIGLQHWRGSGRFRKLRVQDLADAPATKAP